MFVVVVAETFQVGLQGRNVIPINLSDTKDRSNNYK
jgi:hypothetical protein